MWQEAVEEKSFSNSTQSRKRKEKREKRKRNGTRSWRAAGVHHHLGKVVIAKNEGWLIPLSLLCSKRRPWYCCVHKEWNLYSGMSRMWHPRANIICTERPPSPRQPVPAPTYPHWRAISPCCTTAPLSSRWHTRRWVLEAKTRQMLISRNPSKSYEVATRMCLLTHPRRWHPRDSSPGRSHNRYTLSCRYRISSSSWTRPPSPRLRW